MALIRFQLRGDTAADWAAANPVLANREPGVETDTGRMKVGDGVRAWNDLDYASKGDPGPAGEQGLPGVNAVPADQAVAGYVSSGGSQTNAALLGVIGRGQPNGTASLGADGMLPTSQIPAVAYGTVYPAASQAAMLALPASGGDVAARSDGAGSFMLKRNGNPAVLADWVLLNVPTNAVVSVNGQTGTVNLAPPDVGALPVAGTAATATKLATARTIAGKSFDGTANITLAPSDVSAASRTLGGAEAVAALSATTGTATGNCANASVFTVTPTGNITLAFSNVPASGTACTVTVIVTQGATVRAVALPTGGVWLTAAPTQVASKACVITLLTVNGGTTWYASGAVQA